MKIVIFTLGTRGDVQPFLALAVGLKLAGHEVTLAASYHYADWIESYEINFYPITWSIAQFYNKPDVRDAMQSKNIIRVYKAMREGLIPGFIQANDDLLKASNNTDLIILTNPLLCGVEAAQYHRVPVINAFATPIYTPPTAEFPWYGLTSRRSFGKIYNFLSHVIFHNFPGSITPLNKWRASRLGLPARASRDVLNPECSSRSAPSLYALSPAVFSKPKEWGSKHHITGYWFLNAPIGFNPPQKLIEFLADGPKPIYMGFGSMGDKNPEQLTKILIAALERTGQRAILEIGWGGIKKLAVSENIYILEDSGVTHDWLFPRVLAAVHHGGAGTTASILRAGIPHVIIPFTLDQYAWAEKIESLGLGVQVVKNIQQLTLEKLANSLDIATKDSNIQIRVRDIANRLSAENGIDCAVRIIEKYVEQYRQGSLCIADEDIPQEAI